MGCSEGVTPTSRLGAVGGAHAGVPAKAGVLRTEVTIMKMAAVKWSAGIALACLTFHAPSLSGANGVESVTRKGKEVFLVKAGRSEPLTQDLDLPHDIKVMTNGFFTVKGGRPRELQDGQRLSADGMLTSPDGRIVPVMDHIAVKAWKVWVVKDGQGEPLEEPMTLPNGTRVSLDGTVKTANGRLHRLIDGQLYTLSGELIAAKDTITLQEGKVIVQKEGVQFEVAERQSLMMNDGTKVLGDGTVIKKDGTKFRLTEGQIVTVEGVVKLR